MSLKFVEVEEPVLELVSRFRDLVEERFVRFKIMAFVVLISCLSYFYLVFWSVVVVKIFSFMMLAGLVASFGFVSFFV